MMQTSLKTGVTGMALMLAPFTIGPVLAQEAEAPTDVEQEAPPPEVPPANVDTDGDGIADAWDVNGDGAADIWDMNGDGKPDAWDRDGNGEPDAFDTDGDGQPDSTDMPEADKQTGEDKAE